MKISCFAPLFALVLATVLPAEAADPYPSKPVRIVVGFPASGMSDNLARVIANALTQQMGQTFIIDNKPGAGTTIAADNVAKSAPDGHTLFMQDLTSHAISASLYKKLPFDPVKDFTTITLVASTPLVMVVNPAANISSVKELVDLAKASPGKLNYGSSGIGSILHLSGELFKQRAGIDLLVPGVVPFILLVPALLVAGLGAGAVISPNITLTLDHVPPRMGGAAGGALQTGQRIGSALGSALGITAYTLGTTAYDAAAGLRAALVVSALLLASSLAIAVRSARRG